MTFKSKAEKIFLDLISGKDREGICHRVIDEVMKEFRKKDGYFDTAWQEVLERNKGKLIRASVKEILEDMSIEDRKIILGDKDETA